MRCEPSMTRQSILNSNYRHLSQSDLFTITTLSEQLVAAVNSLPRAVHAIYRMILVWLIKVHAKAGTRPKNVTSREIALLPPEGLLTLQSRASFSDFASARTTHPHPRPLRRHVHSFTTFNRERWTGRPSFNGGRRYELIHSFICRLLSSGAITKTHSSSVSLGLV